MDKTPNMLIDSYELDRKLEKIYEEITKLNEAVKEENKQLRGYKVTAVFVRMAQITKDWPDLWMTFSKPAAPPEARINCPQCGVFILDKVGENGLYCNFCQMYVVFEGLPAPGAGPISASVYIDGNVMYVSRD